MSPFRYTLVADGSSDRCLVPIIDWVLSSTPAASGIAGQVANFRHLTQPPHGLAARVRSAFEQHSCELLFVHRDSEREPRENRVQEVRAACQAAAVPEHVPVVPVRMTEAWLLIDEPAIRLSADNPNGTNLLPLPTISRLEATPDPKRILHECLLEACELGRRRREQFRSRISERVQRVAFVIQDWRPLENLSAFRAFRASTEEAVGRILSDPMN